GEGGRDVRRGDLHVLPRHQGGHALQHVPDAFPFVIRAFEGVGRADPLVDIVGASGEDVHLRGDLERLRLVVVHGTAEVVRRAGEGTYREQEARVGGRAVAGVVDRALPGTLGRDVEVTGERAHRLQAGPHQWTLGRPVKDRGRGGQDPRTGQQDRGPAHGPEHRAERLVATR